MGEKRTEKTRRRKLVINHLEKVSGELFESYQDVIKGLIHRRSGVYALYKQSSLYYVGLAGNLMGRLKTHLRDRHKRRWDRFSVYLTVHDDHMKELESLMLRIASPKGNRQGGRFVNSKDARRTLNQLIKAEDEDRRARLLGGMERRRVRAKASRGRGGAVLRGVFDRRIQLRAWSNGRVHRATLRRDGEILYNRVRFALLRSTATGLRSLAKASAPMRSASTGIEPPPANGSTTSGRVPVAPPSASCAA